MNQFKVKIVWYVGAFILACCAVPQLGNSQCDGPSDRVRHCITLNGTASGGTLVFVERLWGATPRYVSINTSAGESPADVATSLASALRETIPISFGSVKAFGPALRLPLTFGSEALAGTETGLGIPKPPLSLSGRYDPKSDQVILNWSNGAESYDELRVHLNEAPAGTTTYPYASNGRFKTEYGRTYFVNGVHGGVPSNYAIIDVSEHAQEELDCPPFYNGIMPNWSSWSSAKGAAKFEQAVKPKVDLKELVQVPQNIDGPDDKPFYQLIKTTAPTVQAGIWRKFLGLIPGHTYRLYARLNTLDMDTAKAEWSYSLHAAYNARSGADLTVDQLSGKSALPDGSTGVSAARIVQYGPSVTTKGEWSQSATGDAGSQVKDITLPDGVNTITVWVRHSGANTTGVGIDWVKLEDLTK